MSVTPILGVVILVLVLIEYVVPGRTLYHTGWYNAVIAALAVWMIVATMRGIKNVPQKARPATWIVAFGIVAVAFAGVISGLLAPDNQIVIGAPGAIVSDTQAGISVAFPPLDRANDVPPLRITPSAIVRRVERSVVEIDARDARGGHLTVTQPTATAFLSPVLLLQQQQSIGGLVLPYDSFALPAEHRIVKAVLFSATQAATLPALAGVQVPVVLFDVEDESGTSIPHGIGIAPDGQSATIAGVRLAPHVFSYPAVEIVAIPEIAVVAIGIAAAVAGLLLTRRLNQGTIPQR